MFVSPVSGIAPLLVTADASGSSDPDGTIVSYRFDFGDGAVAGPQTEPTASHTYYAVGDWTASVTVIDDGGHENTATAPVSVARANQPPNGTINTPSRDVAITVGQSVKFTGTGTDPEGDLPLAFLWDFGGGAANQTVEDPGAVVFNRAGTFTVTFTVTDHLGLADPTPAIRHITVKCPTTKPHAVLAVTPRAGLAPLAVTADASGSTDCSGTIVSYRFNFGDGTIVGPQAEATATHTYAAGNWTARVVVTDDHGAADSTSVAVLSGSVCADNQVGNSSFETDLAGWSGVAGAGLSQVTGGLGGDFSCQVQGPANTQTFGLNDTPNWVTAAPAANSVYTIKAWVRSATALGQVKLMAREIFAGGSVGGWKNSTSIKLSPAWNQIALKFTATKAGSAVDIEVVDKPAKAGEVFQSDVISICAGATGAPLADVEDAADEDVADAAPEEQDLAPSLAPNPVADRGMLRFTTHASGPLQVMLFDIAGRRVRTLVDTPDAPGGMHEFAIDNHGDDGARLRAGVYFYRIHSVAGTTSGHFLLMR